MHAEAVVRGLCGVAWVQGPRAEREAHTESLGR